MATRTWRVAKCLDVLLGQWNAAHPNRSIASDGSIGDDAHASRISDHNPWVDDPASPLNVVTARDFTHDPANGADAGQLAEALRRHKDPRVKYVIWNRRIWSLARDAEGWRPYAGENAHTHHVHVSCSSSKPLYDSTRPWDLSLGSAGGVTGAPSKGEEPMTEADIQKLLDTVIRKDGLTVRQALAGADFGSDQLADAGKLQKTVQALAADVAEIKQKVGA